MNSKDNHYEEESIKEKVQKSDEIPVIIKGDSKISKKSPSEIQNEMNVSSGGNGKTKSPPKSLPEGSQDDEGRDTPMKETDEKVISEAKIENKDDRIKELEEQVKRLSAEFDNFRKRQEKRYDEMAKYAAEDVITQFLPVLDSINQARAVNVEESGIQAIKKGLDMLASQLGDTLSKLGVREIEALNSPFDPALHHAVLVEETDKYPEDTAIEEFQKGYIFKDKVIRPAMVKVSKKP